MIVQVASLRHIRQKRAQIERIFLRNLERTRSTLPRDALGGSIELDLGARVDAEKRRDHGGRDAQPEE
jgi:hypothetical protein